MSLLPGSAPKLPYVHVAKVQALVFRVPIDEPVQTSFGIMHDRPSVLVRVEDTQGCVGWGEIWCNYPAVGAEHRARLFDSAVAPILLEREWASPDEFFGVATTRLHVLGIQCGEHGTVAQALAGADMALWDLVARRAGQPLWRLFGGTNCVNTYASGLSPTHPEKLAAVKRDEGFRAFKLKVGFGPDRDLGNLRALRGLLGDDTTLMVDANQAWDVAQAIDMSRQLARFAPAWLEEPIAADRPWPEWVQLAKAAPLPLAAGENLRGRTQFSEALACGAFTVMQPDIGKWGGFSGCVAVGREVLAAGSMFCPHWLGGGIGLLASMHLKGAIGGPGYVEVDANLNPLRELLAMPYPQVCEGFVTLSDAPGLGVEPDLAAARRFLVRHA